MKQVSGKEFLKILQRHGWTLARINGSHHILVKEGHRERIVVPVQWQSTIEDWIAEKPNEDRGLE